MNILKYLIPPKHKDANYCWACEKWKKEGSFDEFKEFECKDCQLKRQTEGSEIWNSLKNLKG